MCTNDEKSNELAVEWFVQKDLWRDCPMCDRASFHTIMLRMGRDPKLVCKTCSHEADGYLRWSDFTSAEEAVEEAADYEFTARDEFAAVALQGMLAGNVMADAEGGGRGEFTVSRLCDDAVLFGNGMMRAIERDANPVESVVSDD